MPESHSESYGFETVEQDHPIEERIGDAVLTGECHDSVWVDQHEGGVRIVVDQCTDAGRGRHALARLSPNNARRLAALLVRQADDADLRATVQKDGGPDA